MRKNSKVIVAVAAIVGIGGALILNDVFHFTGGHGRAVDSLIARNIDARGGADAWSSVTTLQMTGRMDLGKGMIAPYVMEQKRQGKVCLEFVFDDETAVQCANGDTGWKVLPFRGRRAPEPMTDDELNAMADTASIDGLLFNSDARGHRIDFLGKEDVDGQPAHKLQVTLPHGDLRWVYIDEETSLEVKVEAMRLVSGKQRLVETYFDDWREADGLLIPRRQETRTEGDPESYFLSVESVQINLPLDDSRFEMPMMTKVAGEQARTSSL